MNVWIQTRIQELKIWLKVSTAMCFIAIFGMGLNYCYLAYAVNVRGDAVFWANPSVEGQIAMLDEPTPSTAKKVRK